MDDASAGRAVSRRWFLAGGIALVAGAGAGVGTAYAWPRQRPKRPPSRPPRYLVAAVAAELALIGDLDSTTGGPPEVRMLIRQIRADHAAHVQALSKLVATYPDAPHKRLAAVRGTPRTQSRLQLAEASAATAVAALAARLSGADAALFASIAACEATHAELLK